MTLSRVAVDSPIGVWVIEGDADGLTRIDLPRRRVSSTTTSISTPVRAAARQIEQYFAGRRQHFEVDLHLEGTPFQQDVWLALTEIPYGEVRSYGDIAGAIGRPHAYRAVGNANSKNPWPIIVPCHRVVASDGIGGYAGGLDVKRFLLHLEGVNY